MCFPKPIKARARISSEKMHTAPPVKHEVPVVTPEKAMRTSKETRQRAKELLSTKYVRRFG